MAVTAINGSLMRLEHRAERIDPSTLVETFVDVGPLFHLLGLLLSSLGARPKTQEQLGDAIGFRLVRCIQVVEAFKAQRGEVREVPSQSFPDHLPTRMGEASPRIEDGRWKRRVPIVETLVALQCSSRVGRSPTVAFLTRTARSDCS